MLRVVALLVYVDEWKREMWGRYDEFVYLRLWQVFWICEKSVIEEERFEESKKKIKEKEEEGRVQGLTLHTPNYSSILLLAGPSTFKCRIFNLFRLINREISHYHF